MHLYRFPHRQQTSRTVAGALLLIVVGLPLGCGGGPTAVDVPDFDPADAAEQAMEIYDSDGDGYVAGAELEAAPGLNAAIKNLDADSDGKVSEEEIAERVRTWQQMQIGLMTFTCDVTLNGRPLEGATVTFEPEGFLSGVIQPAVGMTDMGGSARPKVPKELRPSPDTPPGVQAGLYKVKISLQAAGSEKIPAEYNTETTLGQEVSRDDWAISNKQVKFHLKTR